MGSTVIASFVIYPCTKDVVLLECQVIARDCGTVRLSLCLRPTNYNAPIYSINEAEMMAVIIVLANNIIGLMV